MKKNGFTLIELISVIVILSIIIMLIIPTIINNISDKKEDAYQKNIDIILSAARGYVIDYDIETPTSISLDELCGIYFECPIINPKDNEEIEGYVVVDDERNYYFVNGVITLEVDLNGGSTSQEFDETYLPYTKIDLKDPIKDTYTFDKWIVVKGNSIIKDSNLTIGTEDTIIIANWLKEVGLEVDLNGGSTTQEFETIYEMGTNIVLNNPIKKGYTFTGWQIVSGDSILSGDNLTIGSVNTVIKATYSPITYTINYNVVNDSSGNSYPNKGTYDSILTIKNPIRTGYTFDGWMATNIDTTTAKYGTTSPNTIWNGITKVKDTYFINLRSSVGTVTMNANYTATSQTLTVNLNGGTTSQSFNGTYKTNEVITLTNPTRTGYTFKGWSVTSGNSILSGNTLTMGSQNTTITANWKSNKLITYIENLYNTAATENGLVKDDTEDKNIRYAGSDEVVKNYVSFDGDVWRIIGIVDGKVKLVKEESIGRYSWDSSASDMNSGYGYNIWETTDGKTKLDGTTKADLNILLNDGYYGGNYPSTCYGGRSNATKACPTEYINSTLKSMVDENAVWYLGGHNSSSIQPKEMYGYERGTKVYSGYTDIVKTEWTGPIGLIYPSDYGYAADRTQCTETLINYYNNTTCTSNNWLYKNSSYWTKSPHSGRSNRVFLVDSRGCADSGAYNAFGVWPAVYLKSNILIESGDGSSSNPYILIID